MLQSKKIELLYVKLFWVFIFIFGLNIFIESFLNYKVLEVRFLPQYWEYIYVIIIAILNTSKYFYLKNGKFNSENVHFIFRAIEIPSILFSIVFLGINQPGYILIALPILITGYNLGYGKGYLILGYTFICHLFLEIIYLYMKEIQGIDVSNSDITNKSIVIIFCYIIFIFLIKTLAKLYKSHSLNNFRSQELIKELEEKYNQLMITQKEVNLNYEKLKNTNLKLEEINLKLNSSLTEFYTLQRITKVVSSIVDIRELLRHVNDIIIGVMGITNSTILLYDEKRNKLKISATSIKDKRELAMISDNINCPTLINILNVGEILIENFVDPGEYIFTKERNISSLVCVPLITKTRKFGIIIIEHIYKDAFDEENIRLLEIIRQQVCIALENAELYRKMHELAIIDNLTGVHNRLYFHEKFKEELNLAIKNNYKLSIAILDIDHFKRFNDTYGHVFGDKVLKHVVNIVRYLLRGTDIIARFGGEEFVILFPRTDIRETYDKVEFLRKKVETSRIKSDGVDVSVTVSFGISGYPTYGDSDVELLKSADIALYHAKKSGRNCVRIANSSSNVIE